MSNSNSKSQPMFKRLFLILVILVGLAINVFLIKSFTSMNSKAAGTPVEIYFTPGVADIPPETAFQLNVDPKNQTISFVSVKLYFDPNLLQLTSEVDTSKSPYSGKLSVTSMSEANSTGFITIILFQQAGQPIPTSNTFELARFTLTNRSGAPTEQTEITVVDEDTQLVDSKTQELDYLSTYATINLSNSSGVGGGAVPGMFFKMFRGDCADDHIDTAIGCIPISDTNAMAKFFLAWGMGAGAGIAFILIVYAGFILITSSGDPQKTGSAKQLMTAAISGLIMIISSAFILRLIGVDLFRLVGF